MDEQPRISDEQYEVLFTFRHALARFLRWSQRRVAHVGLTEQQYLLILAVRARSISRAPSIRDLAEDLLIRPNSAVELVDRTQSLGLVERHTDPSDLRVVRVSLTARGEDLLEGLAGAHLAELERIAATLHLTPAWLTRLAADFIGESSADHG